MPTLGLYHTSPRSLPGVASGSLEQSQTFAPTKTGVAARRVCTQNQEERVLHDLVLPSSFSVLVLLLLCRGSAVCSSAEGLVPAFLLRRGFPFLVEMLPLDPTSP